MNSKKAEWAPEQIVAISFICLVLFALLYYYFIYSGKAEKIASIILDLF